jgi:hypothetical protein
VIHHTVAEHDEFRNLEISAVVVVDLIFDVYVQREADVETEDFPSMFIGRKRGQLMFANSSRLVDW